LEHGFIVGVGIVDGKWLGFGLDSRKGARTERGFCTTKGTKITK
jgi:hypothetical protein